MRERVAIVTGGCSGLGASIVRCLLQSRYRVIVADLGPGAAAPEIPAGATFARLDVRDSRAFAALASETANKWGGLDMIVNSAGLLAYGLTYEISLRSWHAVVDTNLYGVIHGSLAGLEEMRKQGHGHIVNIASLSGLLPMPLYGPYTASKWGVVGFSRALRLEVERFGISVTVACPGNIDTPMVKDFPSSWLMPKVSADTAARKIVDGAERGKRLVIFPAYARVLWWLERISPNMLNLLHRTVVAEFFLRRS